MKICVVGNGVGAIARQNGSFIDSCDVVVRIKNFELKGFEEFVGSKTDVFSSKWFSWFDRNTNEPLCFDFLDSVKTLMFMFPNEENSSKFHVKEYVNLYKNLQLTNELPAPLCTWSDHKSLLIKFNLIDKHIIYFSDKDIEELCCDILKIDKIDYVIANRQQPAIIEPTCGIRTIFKIIKEYPNDEIFLTGFDGFVTSWYWNPQHKINPSHHYLTERMYLNYLKKTKQVIFL